jgi:serine/threonine-protein kinase
MTWIISDRRRGVPSVIDDPRVNRLLEELLESGGSPEEACRACPELLPRVRAGLEGLRRLERHIDVLFPSTDPPGDAPTAAPRAAEPPRIPGYEVEEELGRGGMGVVYRARHTRLDRPVAIKMLLAGPYARPEERERFLREARALAALVHPNVVQVHEVGELDGLPFFTMEHVDGGTLARKLAGVPLPPREAATLAATLAVAVEAAHRRGIVHRDLKPANVLLTADGTPKVADFGLARRLDDPSGATLTGTALGTPSYMAPEQARGQTHSIGPAVDVYALGAILYETLTGRPPFRAESPAETVQQVLHEDPAPPSRFNARVPRALETICLKCLHKEPGRRYAGAAALAEDLRRYLRGDVITARPAGSVERLARWVRRRPERATLVLGVVLAVLVLGGAAARRIRQQWRAEAALEAELQEAARLRQRAAYWEASVALERARARLGDGGPARLVRLADQARRDLDLPLRLDAIHRERLTLVEGRSNHAATARFSRAQADREYEGAFRGAGLGGPSDDPAANAARLRTSAVLPALVAALDDWASCSADGVRRAWALRVARAADPDPWRDRARDPAAWDEPAALAELARTAPLAEQPVSLLLALGERLQAAGGEGIGFVRRVQQAHPDDFWANLTLGTMSFVLERRNEDAVQAVPYYQRALTARPGAVAVLNDLAMVYVDRHLLDDNDDDWGPGAISRFRRVLEIDPTFAPAHNNLGIALKTHKGDWTRAAPHFREALRLDPRLATAHVHLGEIEAPIPGRLDAAIHHYRQALDIDPDFALAHYGLGVAVMAYGRFDEVNARYPEGDPRLAGLRDAALKDAWLNHNAVRNLDPRWAPAPNALQPSHKAEARLDEAIGHFREAIRLDPRLSRAHGSLGQVLLARWRFVEADEAIWQGLDLLPPWENEVRANLEQQRLRCERLADLQARLAAVVQGEDRPKAGDRLDLAVLCYLGGHNATAARLYAEAFAAAPRLVEDLPAGHRFNAACAAALAGFGRGDDASVLGERERQTLRERAREYLRRDLADWARKLDADTPEDRLDAQNALSLWRNSPDLSSLRDPVALDRLPPPERQQCRALWRDYDALLERAQDPGK